MSDHESEVSPTTSGGETEANAPFSTNGSDRSGSALETAFDASDQADDGATFLADLARAMQSTAAAEQARNAEGTDQRRQAHIDAIRAREAIEAEDLRELAKEDVKGIDAWSDGEIKRVKLERERRIAARREQLQIRLEEHRSVVAREVEAVEAAVAAYRSEIEGYFQRLEAETDPVAIARYAGNRPAFPVLELIGPDDTPSTSPYAGSIAAPAAIQVPATVEPAAHDEPPGDGHDDPPAGDGSMIGVMGLIAASEAPAEQWAAAPEPEPEPVPVAVAAPVAEAQPAPVPETVAETAPDVEQVVSEATDVTATAESADGSQEPVGALAEAHVVMPRAGGAGSWLRWPNSSADHTDSGH